MYKILAPTDFSNNSKRGMRFAMQWATQQKTEIIFIHVYHPVGRLNWNEKEFKLNVRQELERLNIKLKKFVEKLYISAHLKPGKYSCRVIQGLLSADIDIIDFCQKEGNIDFICMSTRGAGKIDKLFGTHTGTLITHSPVPVIAVPRNYRKTSLNNLLYASDFKNFSLELKKVIDFAQPLHAKINVLHLNSGMQKIRDNAKFEQEITSKSNYEIKLHIRNKHFLQSLTNFLQKEKITPKPSLIIMFTEQKRNILRKFLSPSKTEILSFKTSIPLLAFHKD
jgi:nucleotide-binding universal stress UspA family protein